MNTSEQKGLWILTVLALGYLLFLCIVSIHETGASFSDTNQIALKMLISTLPMILMMPAYFFMLRHYGVSSNFDKLIRHVIIPIFCVFFPVYSFLPNEEHKFEIFGQFSVLILFLAFVWALGFPIENKTHYYDPEVDEKHPLTELLMLSWPPKKRSDFVLVDIVLLFVTGLYVAVLLY